MYDPQKHHRRSIRLPGYDYSKPGSYFVTLCVQEREHLFGEVVAGEMILHPAGEEIERWWRELSVKFLLVDLDEHVTMPNHFHGIVVIVDPQTQPYHSPRRRLSWQADSSPFGEIMQWFKTMTTNAYIRGVSDCGWTRFQGRLWQRNYYEHIIRTGRALHNIRNYIRANPAMWAFDRDNLQAVIANPDAMRQLLSVRFGLTAEEIEFVLEFDPYKLEEYLYPE